jgi:peptidyl-prolyl cis-trans isomerase D
MSIIQNIRERGTWIILGFIAIALIAFILQDGIGRNNKASNQPIVGDINGKKININDIEEIFQYKLKMLGSQNIKREDVLNRIWDNELYTELISEEAEKIGLAVGAKETEDVIYGNESPFTREPFNKEFIDQNTGRFKVEELKTILTKLKKSNKKEDIEQRESLEKNEIIPATKQRLAEKYITLLIKGVQTPKWLLEKQYAESNATANINYVFLPYTTIPDNNIKVTNDEIAAYLKENSNAFQIEETQRNLSFINFSATPTPTDSLVIKKDIISYKEAFKTATDLNIFLNSAGSEIPYDSSYYSKKNIKFPTNIDSLISTPIGSVYGPYIDGKNYTMTKVVGTKQWSDSTSVRYILLATNGQTGSIDSIAKNRIDSIQFAIKGGAPFDELAKKYSDDTRNKDNGGVLETLTQKMQVAAEKTIQYPKSFLNYVFSNPQGTKGVVKTEWGYQYVEILKQSPPQAAYNLAQLSKPISASAETISTARAAAIKFTSTCKDVNSFITNAKKIGKQVTPVTGIRGYDFYIKDLGEKRELVKWLFEKNINDISEPIDFGENFVVAVITGEDKPGLASVETAKTMSLNGINVVDIIRNKKKAEQLKAKLIGASIESIATSNNTQVQKQENLKYSDFGIGTSQFEPKTIGLAFNKTLLNKVSKPIVGNAGVYVISLNGLGASADQQGIDAFKARLNQNAENTISRSFMALKKSAKIIDNRTKLF